MAPGTCQAQPPDVGVVLLGGVWRRRGEACGVVEHSRRASATPNARFLALLHPLCYCANLCLVDKTKCVQTIAGQGWD